MRSGFIASTMTDPAVVSARTTTLQGSSRPISRTIPTARCASVGLHAPRIRYFSMSVPSLAFRVACMSISVSTPKPCSDSAALVAVTAVSKSVSVKVVESAMVMVENSFRSSNCGNCVPIRFGGGEDLVRPLW